LLDAGKLTLTHKLVSVNFPASNKYKKL